MQSTNYCRSALEDIDRNCSLLLPRKINKYHIKSHYYSTFVVEIVTELQGLIGIICPRVRVQNRSQERRSRAIVRSDQDLLGIGAVERTWKRENVLTFQ